MGAVVMVVSGAKVWTMKNAMVHPTGFWSEEFVTPHRKFMEAGLRITVASPAGVSPTVDPLSFNLSYNNNDATKVRDQQDYMRHLGPALTSPSLIEDAGGFLTGFAGDPPRDAARALVRRFCRVAVCPKTFRSADLG